MDKLLEPNDVVLRIISHLYMCYPELLRLLTTVSNLIKPNLIYSNLCLATRPFLSRPTEIEENRFLAKLMVTYALLFLRGKIAQSSENAILFSCQF